MKRIFSIIMEKGLDLPTGTIAFWGTLVPRILTVDYTFKHWAMFHVHRVVIILCGRPIISSPEVKYICRKVRVDII